MKTAYKNGYILNGERDMTPLAGHAVLVDGNRIADVVPDEAVPQGYETVDLHQSYIMPGLINLHVHIPASGKPKKNPMDTKKLVRTLTGNSVMRKVLERIYVNFARTELMSGVTTIRTVGGIMSYDTWLRDRIAAGKILGPRVLASNMAVSVPEGHMAGSLAYEASTAEDASAYVQRIAADSPDLIKLMITGGVLDAIKRGEPGILKMKSELVKAACDEAHRLGLPVAAHAESTEGVLVALKNGVDTIEHGAAPNHEMLQLFKERGSALVTTISPALPYALFDLSVSHCGEVAQYNGKIVMDGIISCAKACLEHEISVGLGTDTGCPFVTHYGMWRELAYFEKYCGVSRSFALFTATKGNAEIAGLGDVTGSIHPGKEADMIVTVQNPLENLRALRDVEMVVVRGKRIDAPRVKKMAKVESQLDKYL